MLTTSQEYSIKGNKNEIIQSFLDLMKFGSHHPLIYRVETHKKEGEDKTYKIFEKPFAWLPIRITYYATVKSLAEDKIQYLISGIPFTKGSIDYKFSFNVENKKCDIRFDLRLDSKLPGKKILLNKMMAAQNQLMQNLQESIDKV